MTEKITFKNAPRFSEFEAHKTLNERREKLIPQISGFVSGHDLFKGKEVQVTYMHRGVGSLVCLVESLDNKYILKIPLSLNFSEGEAEFLQKWMSFGVKTPKVFDSGKILEHHYTIMEYIDAPTLHEKYDNEQLLQMEMFVSLGGTLRKMHEPKSEGFGRVVNGKAEFGSFDEWTKSEDLQKRIKYVRENDILSEEQGSLDSALAILVKFCDKQGGTSYCHDDFNISNIFATEPITVFDPNPKFNIGYFDLARSLLLGITTEDGRENRQWIKGYFGDESHDERVLHSALLLNCYIKSADWHKKKKDDFIKGARMYLSLRKGLV